MSANSIITENKPKPIPPKIAGDRPALSPKMPPVQKPPQKPLNKSDLPRYDSMLHSNALKIMPKTAKFLPVDHALFLISSAISFIVGTLCGFIVYIGSTLAVKIPKIAPRPRPLFK